MKKYTTEEFAVLHSEPRKTPQQVDRDRMLLDVERRVQTGTYFIATGIVCFGFGFLAGVLL